MKAQQKEQMIRHIPYQTFISTCSIIKTPLDGFILQNLPVSANAIDHNDDIVLQYHIDRFNDIISILRYEKPLFIYIYTESLTGGIATELEPLGEEES